MKTEDTQLRYLSRAEALRKRFIKVQNNKQSSQTGDENYDFVFWLINKKKEWTYSTWRQNKAAVTYWLETNGKTEHITALNSDLANSTPYKKKKQSANTSTQKAKYIHSEDYTKLVSYLAEQSETSTWAPKTLIFFGATLATGLRPIEWLTAQMLYIENEGRPTLALKVKNAKNTNGRSHGEFRHIILTNYNEQTINVIKWNISSIIQWLNDNPERNWENYYTLIRNCMYKATKDLWPLRSKRPSLYSARHQFIANLKKSGFTRVEIAALAGHGDDLTASRHYGKKRSGRNVENTPIPVKAEVAKVKESIPWSKRNTLR